MVNIREYNIQLRLKYFGRSSVNVTFKTRMILLFKFYQVIKAWI